jgi:hypothetical protein
MGTVKNLKRRERNVRLLERRLRRQRQLPGAEMEQALIDAENKGVDRGYRQGALDGIAECLQATKDTRSIASARKAIGNLQRAALRPDR